MPNETMLKILFELAEQNQAVTFMSSDMTDASVIVANLLTAGAPKVILLLKEPAGKQNQGYLDKAEIEFTSAMLAALDYLDGDPLKVKAKNIHGANNYVQLTIALAK